MVQLGKVRPVAAPHRDHDIRRAGLDGLARPDHRDEGRGSAEVRLHGPAQLETEMGRDIGRVVGKYVGTDRQAIDVVLGDPGILQRQPDRVPDDLEIAEIGAS